MIKQCSRKEWNQGITKNRDPDAVDRYYTDLEMYRETCLCAGNGVGMSEVLEIVARLQGYSGTRDMYAAASF